MDDCKSTYNKPQKVNNSLYTTYVKKIPLNFKIWFNKHNIFSCEYVNYLGINLDQNLNFKPHISILAKKVAKSVGMLWKLRKFLIKKTLVSLYYAFVHSHLLYGIVTLGPSVSSNTLNQLQLLQNNSIRAIVGLKKSQHITSSYRELEILKTKNLCNFEIAKPMFLYHYSRLPITFNNYFVTSSAVHNYSNKNYHFLK